MSFVDVHDLYRLKGLLHRDISIFNMAFYRKPSEKVVGTLIDFDLAIYPEEAALPFIQVAALVPERPHASVNCNPTIDPNDNTQNQKPTAGGDEMPQNGQDRSGTALFMALESLDLTTPNYKHHVCHELESIFYASVWHGIGYRHKAKILPRPPSTQKSGKKIRAHDYLRGWRVGTWSEVMKEKTAFLSSPGSITSLIKNRELSLICYTLASSFRARRLVAEIENASESLACIDKAWEGKDDDDVDVDVDDDDDDDDDNDDDDDEDEDDDEAGDDDDDDDSDNGEDDDDDDDDSDEDEEEADFPIEDIHEISTDKPLRYETVVYPTFARCLRMKVVTCTEDCCVRVSSI